MARFVTMQNVETKKELVMATVDAKELLTGPGGKEWRVAIGSDGRLRSESDEDQTVEADETRGAPDNPLHHDVERHGEALAHRYRQ